MSAVATVAARVTSHPTTPGHEAHKHKREGGCVTDQRSSQRLRLRAGSRSRAAGKSSTSWSARASSRA